VAVKRRDLGHSHSPEVYPSTPTVPGFSDKAMVGSPTLRCCEGYGPGRPAILPSEPPAVRVDNATLERYSVGVPR